MLYVVGLAKSLFMIQDSYDIHKKKHMKFVGPAKKSLFMIQDFNDIHKNVKFNAIL